jgi:hypothetical protein
LEGTTLETCVGVVAGVDVSSGVGADVSNVKIKKSYQYGKNFTVVGDARVTTDDIDRKSPE